MTFVVAACGSSGASDAADDDAGPKTDTPTEDAGGFSGTDAKVGDFIVRLVRASTSEGGTEVPGFTSLSGKVYDGPVPEALAWNTSAEDADCVLLEPEVPFCDPPCVGEVCVAGDTCQANPSPLDLGDIVATGLTTTKGAAEITLKPIAGNYSAPADIDLPYPAFGEGDEIRFEVEGGSIAAFTLTTKGITPLTVTSTALALDETKDLALTWEAAGAESSSRVHVKLDISHHGGTKGKIECDTADDGALDISASLIGKLKALGVAGFPTIVVTRSSVGETRIAPGTVALTVTEDVELAVEIPGLVSCTDADDCPEGTTCQSDLTCK